MSADPFSDPDNLADSIGRALGKEIYRALRSNATQRRKSPYPPSSIRKPYNPDPQQTRYLDYVSYPSSTLPISTLSPEEWTHPEHSRKWLLPRDPPIKVRRPMGDAYLEARSLYGTAVSIPPAALPDALNSDIAGEIPSIYTFLDEVNRRYRQKMASSEECDDSLLEYQIREYIDAASIYRHKRYQQLQKEPEVERVTRPHAALVRR